MNKKPKEIHYRTLSDEELKKLEKKKTIKSFINVVLGSVLYAIGVVWILRLGGFVSGGVTGLSQLIVGLVEHFCDNEQVVRIISSNLGTLVMLINVPLLIFGWKGVSKKFAILTLVSIIVQSVSMNLLSTYTISPFVTLLTEKGGGEGILDIFTSGNFKFIATAENLALQETFRSSMSVGLRLMLAISGGAICGLGAAITLTNGGSSGGTDIIANYLQVKKHIPFTKYSSLFDTCIIVASGLISVEIVLYTLIRLFVYVRTIKSFYQIYNTNRIEIVTTKGLQIKEELMKKFNHSLTIYQCIGGYTNELKESIVIYASSYEVDIYANIIKDIDPRAFITITKANIKKSNFVQKSVI